AVDALVSVARPPRRAGPHSCEEFVPLGVVGQPRTARAAKRCDATSPARLANELTSRWVTSRPFCDPSTLQGTPLRIRAVRPVWYPAGKVLTPQWPTSIVSFALEDYGSTPGDVRTHPASETPGRPVWRMNPRSRSGWNFTSTNSSTT